MAMRIGGGKVVLLLGGLAVAVGCGSGAPGRVALAGRVNCGDEPVARGTILFAPAGGGGSGITAPIEDGEYAVDASDGVPPGAYLVRIMGYDGKPMTGRQANPLGNPLPPYQTRVEVPEGGAPSLDFSMPASPARPPTANR
jgi:hypothetical protein